MDHSLLQLLQNITIKILIKKLRNEISYVKLYLFQKEIKEGKKAHES